MTALHTLGPQGATATFATRPDRALLGADLAFVLDPLLLDTATHPMWSAEPERWVEALAPGHLAYPVHAEKMRFFGPRPTGAIQFAMTALASDTRTLRFGVHMGSEAGPWCAFEWTEAVVAAGPLLGRSASERRAFLWEGRALPQITIGEPTDGGWQVEHEDLIEPLPGTLVRLTCAPVEVAAYRAAPDRVAWAAARIAAKEALRQWMRERTGLELHPRDLVLLAMRPDRYVVIEAGPLDAQTFSEHLGPTRFTLTVETTATGAAARISPLSIPHP